MSALEYISENKIFSFYKNVAAGQTASRITLGIVMQHSSWWNELVKLGPYSDGIKMKYFAAHQSPCKTI